MYGLDLSKHNGTVDFKAIKEAGNDFVILRAGYGVSGTKDSKFDTYYKQARQVGLRVGAYWYSYGLSKGHGKKEAMNMYEVIKSYELDMPVYIDMEDADNYKEKNGMPSNDVLCSICEEFCEYMESKGYYAGIYASESWFKNQLKNVSTDYDKWVANWGTNDGTLQSNKFSYGHMHQFTSKYKLGNKTFDRNVTDTDFSSFFDEIGMKSNSEIAIEVINGDWGTGSARQEALEHAGYNYKDIQSIVNKYYDVADDVIAGKYGNGQTRKDKLKKAGYDYETVQMIVNEKLS